MTDIETASQLLGVDAKWLQAFDVTDPFNDESRLEGFLSLRPDHRYGALALLRVGGQPAPQVIYATPKLHYPFGKDGSFHFPPIRRAIVYEKLDGTNVLAYRYWDASGGTRLTYKLRLAPVLRNSKWGPFLDYWKELLAKYPDIPRLAQINNCNVSLEMYGARNAHLLAYQVDLEAAVLFGIRPADAAIIPPFELQTLGVPVAPLLVELDAAEDPVNRYGALRAVMESRNRPAEDEKLTGIEGAVWYVSEPSGRVTLWKCKPESVEEIHWATGINKAAVVATCWNALETSDVLNYEVLLPLLLEEYQQDDIERFRSHIDEAIAEVNREFNFRQKVWAAYNDLQAKGLSLRADKGQVMRALSQQFRREEIQKVYTAIARREGLI
ncbi:MAG: hypothetical protein C5B50_28390 [Verrucomicrobia bacterium]|nr:MAG: hypothetical protein C5B50_28390 [Verrucomicrobiota bacterium]